jgi:hypothetical protein
LEPIAEGLHITHWTSTDLARQAVADGIVDSISPRTVERILRDVDLQPHRTRYWRTARLDAQFKDRAEKVLWCYGNAERLARQGIWTVAVDEMPNLQVLERRPIRRAIPGFIERQEFEYTRHGTVNLLLFLVVHTGQMEVTVEASKDAEHYVRGLRAFRRRHRGARRPLVKRRAGKPLGEPPRDLPPPGRSNRPPSYRSLPEAKTARSTSSGTGPSCFRAAYLKQFVSFRQACMNHPC